MKKRITIALLLAGAGLSSCEKVLFEPEQEFSRDPFENFEYLWEQCNTKFSYFELKKIDWEAVKENYAAKLYKGMSDDSLFSVLGGMMNELKDGHSNLISGADLSFFGIPYLGQDNFDWRIIEDNYLSQDYHRTGFFQHDFIADGQVGYIRFPAFAGVTPDQMKYLLNRYAATQGLIFDLRENGGGFAADITTILGGFIKKRTLVHYNRRKNGPGKDDFSTSEPVYIDPLEGVTPYTKKVAVLTDRGTYSAGSFFALDTKAIPNLVTLGDTTGGGLGLPNGGGLPNGWTYRFSIDQALTLDKDPSYEQGVPPDIPVLFDWNDRTRDEVIERALQELL